MNRRSLAALIVCAFFSLSPALAATPPSTQPPELVSDEATAVYLGNLRRRDAGQPPLRANRQLTEAARWFAWDSVENRPAPFCGHTDTRGKTSQDRAREYGYLGRAGAENAFCGYVAPADAVNGWMDSPGHRANLLSGTVRETGLGYYRRASDGRGYVVQMFGTDPDYAPVVINNEAPSSLSPQVSLYTYNRGDNESFAGLGASRAMRIATDPCFTGADWQPFDDEQTYALPAGEGWRTVYVQTRDKLNRTATASDSIYLGNGAPPAELSLDQLAGNAPSVKLYNLAGGGFGQVQLSPGWSVDDTFTTFERLSGAGGRVADPAALGGTAFQLGPGLNSSAWVWTTEFVKNVPLVAYFRLKVDDNTSPGEVASFTIKGGGHVYGPLSLRGTDFAAAGVYQEFALPFTFNDNPNDVFLIFNFARTGVTPLYIDTISLFTPPQPLNGPTLTWPFPGGNYRGQGVQVRYTDGAGHFSAASEAQTVPNGIQPDTSRLLLLAGRDSPRHPRGAIGVAAGCLNNAPLSASASEPWLHPRIENGQLLLDADQSGLAVGHYEATVTISAPGAAGVAPAHVVVELEVVEQLSLTFVPRS